ncbi:MAG: hypothetical protein Q9218_004116 [Villophora microphyllina]
MDSQISHASDAIAQLQPNARIFTITQSPWPEQISHDWQPQLSRSGDHVQASASAYQPGTQDLSFSDVAVDNDPSTIMQHHTLGDYSLAGLEFNWRNMVRRADNVANGDVVQPRVQHAPRRRPARSSEQMIAPCPPYIPPDIQQATGASCGSMSLTTGQNPWSAGETLETHTQWCYDGEIHSFLAQPAMPTQGIEGGLQS